MTTAIYGTLWIVPNSRRKKHGCEPHGGFPTLMPPGAPALAHQSVTRLDATLTLKMSKWKGQPRLKADLYALTHRSSVWLSLTEPSARLEEVTVALGLFESEIEDNFKAALLQGAACPAASSTHLYSCVCSARVLRVLLRFECTHRWYLVCAGCSECS